MDAPVSLRRFTAKEYYRTAQAGPSETGLVGWNGDALHRYPSPGADGYRAREEVGRGGSLAPQTFPEMRLGVGAVLG